MPTDPAPQVETRTLEDLARDGVVVSLSDVGACNPVRPMTPNVLTIPLNLMGECAELRLPLSVTHRELRLIVQYIEQLLLAGYVPTEYTTITTRRHPVAAPEGQG